MSETNSTAVAVVNAPTAIAVGPRQGLPTMPEIEIMRVIASTASKAAGMVPDWIKTEEQALMVMLAGHEMGLTPATALRHVYIVNGRTDFDAQILMGLVKAGDPSADFEFERYDSEGCVVVLHRAGHRPLRVSYTKADAEASGQLKPKQRKKYDSDAWEWNPNTKKNQLKRGARSTGWEDILGPWQLYPRDMYCWAAVKRCGRLGAPELINGIPSRTMRELVSAAPKWVEAPDPMVALNPGDDGKPNPVIDSVMSAPVVADPDTGEIMSDEDEAPEADYVMPDEEHQPNGEASASVTGDDSTSAGDDSSQPQDTPSDLDSYDNTVVRIRSLFDDFRSTQETANVQKLVMRLWAKWPETRDKEDGNLHLELIKPENATALRDWLAKAQEIAGIPD